MPPRGSYIHNVSPWITGTHIHHIFGADRVWHGCRISLWYPNIQLTKMAMLNPTLSVIQLIMSTEVLVHLVDQGALPVDLLIGIKIINTSINELSSVIKQNTIKDIHGGNGGNGTNGTNGSGGDDGTQVIPPENGGNGSNGSDGGGGGLGIGLSIENAGPLIANNNIIHVIGGNGGFGGDGGPGGRGGISSVTLIYFQLIASPRNGDAGAHGGNGGSGGHGGYGEREYCIQAIGSLTTPEIDHNYIVTVHGGLSNLGGSGGMGGVAGMEVPGNR